MKCSFCTEDNVSFIDLEAFKEHMVQEHPDSHIAKHQSSHLEAVGLFSPGSMTPVVLIRNGDTPIFSCLAPDAMRLGYNLLMQGRQMYDDWCLIRVFQANDIPESVGLAMLKELRVLRTGQSTESTDPPPGY